MIFCCEAFLMLAVISQTFYFVRVITSPKNNFPIIDVEANSCTVFALFCTTVLLFKLEIEGYSVDHSFYSCCGYTTIKIIIIGFAYCLLQIILPSFILQKLNFAEFFTFYLISVLSVFVILSAQSLLAFYLAVELQVLCFYVLAAFIRGSAFSVEAGLKYFITGSFISGCFLLGSDFLFSSLGTANVWAIASMHFRFFEDLLELVTFYIVGIFLFKTFVSPFDEIAPNVSWVRWKTSPGFFFFIKIFVCFFLVKGIFVLSWLNSASLPWLPVISLHFLEAFSQLAVCIIISNLASYLIWAANVFDFLKGEEAENYQGVFSDRQSKRSAFIFVLLLTLLIFLLFFPTHLYVFCQFVVLHFFD